MAAKTAAQEEFDKIIANASARDNYDHPDDERDYSFDKENSDIDEEDEFHNRNIEETMKMPLGEKDGGWRNKLRGNTITKEDKRSTFFKDGSSGSEAGLSDDEEFLERWRQQRRVEIQNEGKDIRNRRTSPSVRRYGRFDEVDALGYLDAIEKVGRETIVVVFVYDPECDVSQVINSALLPLVAANPTVHFVRVHYEDIEFENAGVPAILAYKNQGDFRKPYIYHRSDS
ncbi:hypothetical protein DID88_001488 [Monilinia fructigena]|uniref:Phosducin domain-containing protein n=1 Tax=Monilinia fructigena TaxID=38457 RepID=A0A395IZM2_9HELO|nr:hypothetical protein DID88_001488 [Monilinia fructigena]